jgi:Zn-dependent protease
MKNSLDLGKPFGIKLGIHWTFLLLIAYVVFVNLQQGYDITQILLSILFVLTLFVCVVLHEFGHALTARRFGVQTKSITLLPIGGLANIQDVPEKPKQELQMTIAGPLVNLAIALVLYIIIKLTVGFEGVEYKEITLNNFLHLLLSVNIIIAVFNLLPAFPMDGGRVFRAALNIKMSREKATRIAMRIGQGFGLLFILAGLYVNPFLVLIGLFVMGSAWFEYQQIKSQGFLGDYKVEDITLKEFTTLHPDDELKKAIDIMLNTQQKHFIVQHDDKIDGILTKDNIIKGLSTYSEKIEVDRVKTKIEQFLSPKTPLKEAHKLMQMGKIELLPVVKDGKIIGALDTENINEFIMMQSARHQ